ncbi:hypothetical protein EV385_5253 [Krasilnikovia cinnamomea]|uniref:Uncharacterized protein n=1 Tax=Krasilnikovia cinnamomea TaxID=349313 RepID=A0A4Q7ZQD4_9ACTN|nr:hypothetical protein EV385_5253 [Krasilnikovia cinnamomea]
MQTCAMSPVVTAETTTAAVIKVSSVSPATDNTRVTERYGFGQPA